MSYCEIQCDICYENIDGYAEGLIGANIDEGWTDVNDSVDRFFHQGCIEKVFNVYNKHQENNNA